MIFKDINDKANLKSPIENNFDSPEFLRAYIEEHNIADKKDVFIDDTDGLVVNVNGNVNFGKLHLTKIPFKFGKIVGNFSAPKTGLITLENGPDMVGGNFDVDSNNLNSLQYCPKFVGGAMDVSNNDITHIDFLPSEIGKKLKYNEGQPRWAKAAFTIEPSLKLFGNNIKSFHMIHKKLKFTRKISIDNYQVKNRISNKYGYSDIYDAVVPTNLLGFLFIDGLVYIECGGGISREPFDIINEQLLGNRDVHKCQEDLLEAGYPEQAKF